MAANQVAIVVGHSRRAVLRSAHAHGLPVRQPTVDGKGPGMTRLIEALYSDPRVTQALKRHGVAKVPAFGPIWARFPQPAPLTQELARDLYEGCGVALAHVELLTVQPAETVRKHLAGWGIPVRRPGGRCPFLRRLTHDEKQRAEPRTWCLAELRGHYGKSISRQFGLDQECGRSPPSRTNRRSGRSTYDGLAPLEVVTD
jgi:hypothetical protein